MVHGRFDTICRLSVAYKLHKAWLKSELIIVPDAGHSGTEIGIMSALITSTNKMVNKNEI